VTLDTLEYVKKLVAAGVSRDQAEAHAEALRGVVFPELAGKQDLRDMASELRAEITQARNDLHAEIGQLRAEVGQVRTDMWKIALAIVLATASLATFLQRLL
jgi:hypothetical protein